MATTVKNHVIGRDTAIDYPGPVDEFDNTVAFDQVYLSANQGSAVFKIFDADKTSVIAIGETRLRSAVVASGVVLEIPKMTPVWHEVGDTVEIDQDDGSVHVDTVASYSTATASHDEITLTTGVASACAVANKIRLTRKATSSQVFVVDRMIYVKDSRLVVGDTIELETDTIGTFDDLIVDELQRLSAVEGVDSGEVAEAIHQPYYDLILTTAGSSTATRAGRYIRQKIGSDVPMTQYGVTVAGGEEWGFKGTIPDTLDVTVGMTLLIEILFKAAAGLNDKVQLKLPVVGG